MEATLDSRVSISKYLPTFTCFQARPSEGEGKGEEQRSGKKSAASARGAETECEECAREQGDQHSMDARSSKPE